MEAYVQVGDLLRDTYREEVAGVDFSAFWTGVEAGIEALPDRVEVSEASGAGRRLWERLSSWLGENAWRPVATAVVAAAVVFAIVLPRLWDSGHTNDARVANRDVYIQDGRVVEASPDDVLSAQKLVVDEDADLQTEGVEVSQVSEGAKVYVVNGATIIWVDTGEDEGAAI